MDGVLLNVCSTCAKRYSKYIVREVPRSTTSYTKVRTWPTRRRTVPRLEELEYEIVEDYNIRIRKARESLGLTRELLAQELGEKESVIRRIEEGKLVPTLDMARRLERILKIKLLEPVGESTYSYSEAPSRRFSLTLGDIVIIRDRREKEKEKSDTI